MQQQCHPWHLVLRSIPRTEEILELCERLLNLQKIHRYSMHSVKGYIVSTRFTAALCNMLKAHLVGTRFTGALYNL